jgi:hypothetical protein
VIDIGGDLPVGDPVSPRTLRGGEEGPVAGDTDAALRRYSTMAQVRDIDLSIDDLIMACRSHLDCSQWAVLADYPAELDVFASDFIADMADVAQEYPEGTVLRMRFNRHSACWKYTEVEPS